MIGEMTEGRRQLLRVLQRTKVKYVAARCGVTPNAVYMWAAGERRPSKAVAARLYSGYRLRPSLWSFRPPTQQL